MADKLTNRQIRNRVDKEVGTFMANVRRFLSIKAGNDDGTVPEEWELSLTLLEAYYRQFSELNIQISQLDSMVFDGRYGPVPNPLLACRDKASVRLEALMKELGLTMKSAIKLNVVDAKKELSPIEEFMKNKGNKEVR